MSKTLNPKCIPKYVDELPIPPVYKPVIDIVKVCIRKGCQ